MGASSYGSSYSSPFGGGGQGYGMAYGQANPMQAFNASYGQPYGRYSPMAQKSQPFMPGNVADTGNIPQGVMGGPMNTSARTAPPSPMATAVMPQPGMQPRIPANQRFDPYAGGTVPADPDYGQAPMTSGLAQPMQSAQQPMAPAVMPQQGVQGKAMQTTNNAIPGYGPPESQGVPATLDPRSMGWLIGALGGGNFQGIPQDIPTQQNAYQQYYNSSYGNQYTGPGFERSRNYTPFNWDWRQGMPR